jgi:hypothetical protein
MMNKRIEPGEIIFHLSKIRELLYQIGGLLQKSDTISERNSMLKDVKADLNRVYNRTARLNQRIADLKTPLVPEDIKSEVDSINMISERINAYRNANNMNNSLYTKCDVETKADMLYCCNAYFSSIKELNDTLKSVYVCTEYPIITVIDIPFFNWTGDEYMSDVENLAENIVISEEGACLPKKSSQLPANIFLDDFGSWPKSGQWGKWKIIKIQANTDDRPCIENLIPMSIDDNPRLLTANDTSPLSPGEIEQIKAFVKNNKKLILRFSDGGIIDFLERMKVIKDHTD